MPSSKAIRNVLMKGTPATLKKFSDGCFLQARDNNRSGHGPDCININGVNGISK